MAFVPTVAFQNTVPEQVLSGDFTRPRRRPVVAAVRRRPTPEQGRSLEILAHAIEYLVDSDLRDGTRSGCVPVPEAARILMRLNRAVFAECREIVPLRVRLRQRFARLFERKHSVGHVAPAAGPRT